MTTLGQLLCEARVEGGRAQRELAEHLGVKTSYVCDVEKGRRRLSRERILKAADFFEVSPLPLLEAAGLIAEAVLREYYDAAEAGDRDRMQAAKSKIEAGALEP